MPKTITQYRVFIGSPGGLDAERQRFRDILIKFNKTHARQHDVEFEPVGWEDTLPGVGRPQAKINEDLERCDYAIFAFHDRWGSPTGNGTLVGTEEEWEIAERLYSAEGGYQIRTMALYFKSVPAAQEKDPGDEYKKVRAFKAKVFASKQHLCGKFDNIEQWSDRVEEQLAAWLASHIRPAGNTDVSQAIELRDSAPAGLPPASFLPDRSFWFNEAQQALADNPPDYAVALSCFAKAVGVSNNDIDCAKALYGKGLMLSALDRSAEAIAVYDDLIARFGTSDTPALQEQVAKALLLKGFRLSALDRSADEIATYDDLITRFATSDAAALQKPVAQALRMKALTLGVLDRSVEAIAAYDDLITRFGTSDAAALQEQVAKALCNKGMTLGALDHSAEAIAVYDVLITRFGTSDAPALQEQVAKALFLKGFKLSALDRSADEIATYDDLITRFGTSDAVALKEQVAKALYHKGMTLDALDRSVEAIATYNELIDRFGTSDATALQEQVKRARRALRRRKPKGSPDTAAAGA